VSSNCRAQHLDRLARHGLRVLAHSVTREDVRFTKEFNHYLWRVYHRLSTVSTSTGVRSLQKTSL